MMIGMFAISEIIRYAVDTNPTLQIIDKPIGNVFSGMWRLTKKYPLQILRGSALGTLIGALPGAGADIAAWMSYAVSKKFSKEPEKFGTGHVEGIVESGSANGDGLDRLDPVCLMEVDPATARHTVEYGGQTIAFCAPSCKKLFLADPQTYLVS